MPILAPLARGWVPMATPTAPVAVPNSVSMSMHQPAMPSPRPKPRVLWPWPTFLLGIAAVVAVYFARPHLAQSDVDRLQHDLRELHRVLEQGPIDLDRAFTLAKRVVEKSEQFPQYVGESHYLFGCTHLAKADDLGTTDQSDSLSEACKEFELAEQAGVSDTDRPRLNHKFGKALYLSGAEPKTRAL